MSFGISRIDLEETLRNVVEVLKGVELPALRRPDQARYNNMGQSLRICGLDGPGK